MVEGTGIAPFTFSPGLPGWAGGRSPAIRPLKWGRRSSSEKGLASHPGRIQMGSPPGPKPICNRSYAVQGLARRGRMAPPPLDFEGGVSRRRSATPPNPQEKTNCLIKESSGRAPLVEPASPHRRSLERLQPGAPAAREPGRLTVAPFRAWRGSPGSAAQDRTFITGKDHLGGPR